MGGAHEGDSSIIREFAQYELELFDHQVGLLRELNAVRSRMMSASGQVLGSLRDHELLSELEEATRGMGWCPPCMWWVERPEAWAEPRREL